MTIKSKDQKISNSLITKNIQSLEIFWNTKIKEKPIIFVLNSREEINNIRNEKTDKKLVAWFWKDKYIYILNKPKFIKESVWPKSFFNTVLKHELSHFFFYQITKNSSPAWLNEGLACYLSNQKYKEKIEKKEIKKLLSCYYDFDRSLFNISESLVESLINVGGKKNFIKFIKSINKDLKPNDFKNLFQKFYKIQFNTKNLTKLIK
jgi:hypothetical protein